MPSQKHSDTSMQPQLLHEPVLQRGVHTLDAAFGLRRVRADDVDVQVGECTAELSRTHTSER